MAAIGYHNALALLWFLLCWIGYSNFASMRACKSHCLAKVLHRYRHDWLEQVALHDNRVADAAALDNLSHNVNFFASTTILILAGILTVLTTSSSAISLINHLPFTQLASPEQAEFKLLVLAGIFVYAFFEFTWSMRQYGFCSIYFGSMPLCTAADLQRQEVRQIISQGAKLLDGAGQDFNYGLRAYYFALAAIGWLISSWVFVIGCALVVAVLYHREFHSRTLHSLLAGQLEPGLRGALNSHRR